MLTSPSIPMGSTALDGLGGKTICMDIWDIFAHGFSYQSSKSWSLLDYLVITPLWHVGCKSPCQAISKCSWWEVTLRGKVNM